MTSPMSSKVWGSSRRRTRISSSGGKKTHRFRTREYNKCDAFLITLIYVYFNACSLESRSCLANNQNCLFRYIGTSAQPFFAAGGLFVFGSQTSILSSQLHVHW